MRAPKRNSRGYSLVELLTVMAIIGVLSLITVPSFISFQRAGKMKTALRNFAMDLRGMRQRAITQNVLTRVVVSPAVSETVTSRTYTFSQSSNDGTTWTPLSMRGGYGGNTTNVIGEGGGNIKELEKAVFFSAFQNFEAASGGPPGAIQIVYGPRGTLVFFTTPEPATPHTLSMRTMWNVAKNQILITITPSGQLQTAASHV